MATRNVRTIEPDITVVELTGRLNVGQNLSETEDALLDLVRNGAKKVIIDLSTLDYIDSASLGMLTGLRTQLDELGGKIRIAGPHGATARILQVIHMDKIIPVDADVATSQAALA